MRVSHGGQLGHLVEAATAGDRAAFEMLLLRDAPIAYRAALAVLHSPHDAEDALQEAALRAWQRLPQLRDSAGWSAWFHRIAVHAAIDHVRRGRGSRALPLPPDFGLALPDPMRATDDRLTLLEAVGRLSVDDRAILGLRFGADLEVPNLAQVLGIRLGTAKARLHRALARLRAILAEPDEETDAS
jgi:RNA polymerase sigma factor (sigma-70 family)